MRVIDIWSVVIIGVFMVSVGWIVASPTVNSFFDALDTQCKPSLSGLALSTYNTVVSGGKVIFNGSPIVVILALILWGFAKTQQKERVTEYVYR